MYTLLGQIEYLVNSNNNADSVDPQNRYKYINDLSVSVLHLVMMTGLLTNYDIWSHVPSDIHIDRPYLPPETQKSLDKISE